ncbi:MAG: sialate O-acetylesterase, partial [Roseimicrobium sp.]
MRYLLILPFCAWCLTTQANVQLPPIFTDHLILQRDQMVPVWGTANAGETVVVEFAGQQHNVQADGSGKWVAKLNAMPANAEPRTLTVRGENTVVINDVLVGEVWLASGQSNMGFPVSSAQNATEALATASDPLLRCFTVARTTSAEPLREAQGKWEISTADTVKNFSAVAYFFARDLRRKQGLFHPGQVRGS